MTAANFERVMDEVIFPQEGGYVDHPADPGGATNLGITIGTLSVHRGRPVSKAEMRTLEKPEARDIYHESYAAKVMFDDLTSGLDAAMLDYAVNSGPAKAVKSIQAIVGVAQDGVMGPKTLSAIRQRSAIELVNRLCDERLAFLKRLKTYPTFGKGWSRRVAEMRAYALKLARQQPAGAVPVAPAPARKAAPSDTAVRKTSAGKGAIAAIVGSATAGLGQTLQSAHDAIEPYVGVHRYVTYLFVAITFGGLIVAGIGGAVALAAKLRSIHSGAPV